MSGCSWKNAQGTIQEKQHNIADAPIAFRNRYRRNNYGGNKK